MDKCFILDGVRSESIGVDKCYIVRLGENDTMPIFGGQEVIEQQLLNHDHPVFVSSRKRNLKFTLVFSLRSQSFTPQMNYKLGEIFAKSVPVPFSIGEDREKVIYVTPLVDNQTEITRFSGLKGYFEVSFQATTPYWLTADGLNKVETSLQANQEFVVDNKKNIQDRFGKYDFYPKVKFTLANEADMPDTFDFQITNMLTNKVVSFNNCVKNEAIELEGKRMTSSIRENIFKDWNRVEFVLNKGKNIFKTNYACEVYLNPQYPVFQ